MASSGFTTLHRKVSQLEREMSGQASKERLERVAGLTKRDVDEAVRGDLGDLSMSGWRRGNPFPIQGRYDITSDHEFEVNPQRRARGPMRVLQEGRKAYTAGDRRQSGTYTSKKTGLTRARTRTVKRNVGATQGKDTWSDAVRLMEERVPGRVDRELQKAIRKYFSKG